ncbi:hypothetical protein [Enterococcus larvae]|uniref:hypothetical protein n=1 Tax=Enterococcus larvae TaxID=2794352 RepID=UPI003F3EBB52
MTEQKEKLRFVRDNLSELSKTADSDAYDFYEIIENCVSILDDILDDQQQVGEYYKGPSDDICKITSIENETAYVTFVNAERGNLLDSQFDIERDGKFFTKATSEEIALFKRAEHFHSKGRKLNEFKKNDVVCEDDEYQVVFDMGNGLYLYNVYGEVIGEQDTALLIMTAGELEAAAKGE